MSTAQEVADHLDLSRRTFHDIVARGFLPKRGKDGWNIDECRRLYLNYLREEAIARLSGKRG